MFEYSNMLAPILRTVVNTYNIHGFLVNSQTRSTFKKFEVLYEHGIWERRIWWK